LEHFLCGFGLHKFFASLLVGARHVLLVSLGHFWLVKLRVGLRDPRLAILRDRRGDF
jgi:hypothetical protein